jgi:signal transduction histidine kinase
MTRIITIGAAQLGPIQKDHTRQQVVARLIDLLRKAHSAGCDLVVFPELALTTFFPRWFVENISETDHYYEPVISWCDEVSINTVFRNIISNAIKFTPTNGSITIKGKELVDNVEISITDTGIGMPEETIQKIFGENQHFTSSGTDNEQGTGLGLMLVKDFLKKNNGSLIVKSKINEGTKFTITLPKNKTN